MKKKSGKKWIMILLLLVVAGAVVYGWQMKKGAAQNNVMVGSKYAEPVTVGTISVTTEGNGSIEAAEEKAVLADYSLTIDQVIVEEGDQIVPGDVIATVSEDSVEAAINGLRSSLSDLNSSISNMDKSGSSSVTSSISGRVKRIFVKSGDVLSEVAAQNGGIMELSADEKLKVEFSSSRNLKLGDTVRVIFQNFDVEGTVLEQKADGTYRVTILDNSEYQIDTEVNIEKDDVVIGHGVLEINAPYLIDASYGIADEVRVSVGNWVDSGSTLVTRTMTGYNNTYLELLNRRQEILEDIAALHELKKSLKITANETGIVSALALKDDTGMAEGMPIYHVISTDGFWLKAQIDELDIVDVKEGQIAKLVFDAFEDETYEGRVEKISALGTNVGGVTKYTVTIAVPAIDKVKLAMSASATIVLEEHEDALIIPIDAVMTVDGHKCVSMQVGEEEQIVPVTLGLVNNTQAEVLEGLSEGDSVLVQGKSDLERMMDLMSSGRNSRSSGGDF